MTENEAIEVLRDNFPKTCKMVDGRYKGGFDDVECEFGKALLLSIFVLNEIQQYRVIGTVEECREAKERQREKKYKTINMIRHCSECDCQIKGWYTFCPICGQAIDWNK